MEAVRWKNMIPIILLVGLLAITYILLYYKIDAKVVFALKVMTSLGFILLGLYALKHSDGKYPALVISGLVAGFTGDVVLGLRRIDAKRKTKYFIAGIALFFTGHFFYAAAFLLLSSHRIYMDVLGTAGISAVFIIAMNLSDVKCGKLKYLNCAYVLPLSFLVAVTGLNLIFDHNRINAILFSGALTFAVSDILLYLLYFGGMGESLSRKLKSFNIATYYLAQTLFAASIYYL